MIDEFNPDGTGWARFSDDILGPEGQPLFRYRLARSLTGRALPLFYIDGVERPGYNGSPAKRVVWAMLNPSTADAFKLDPTVNECRKRSIALHADVLEVVNLFALRSPYPADLRKRAHGYRGDDAANDAEILAACTGAYRVIAAWGNHGALDHRATVVRRLLAEHGIALHHLGLTGDGFPKHPLVRGVHRIPADLQPIPWSYA